ncbi:Cucumisin [Melia azedarach]|uniref:Cucumisin n=2 Tax=Melia azedarach TaxID=155640 RepID=A0ACC1X5X0_MELAZ|nr:Cucumisin [Melia azedarach]KAJ4706508.1 Cucumisin [Melia azedarach]
MTRSLSILVIVFTILAIFQSHARAGDSRKVYIVFTGPGVKSTKEVHLQYLQKVVVGITPAEALEYSYRNRGAFSARLTENEAKKLEKLDGIIGVILSRTIWPDEEPGYGQLSELNTSPGPM